MKQVEDTEEYKAFLQNRAKKIERNRRRREKKSQEYSRHIKLQLQTYRLKLPANFSTENDIHSVVNFIKKVNDVRGLGYGRVQLDLSDVTSIDLTSITMLLTTTLKLHNKNIGCSGNLPKDESCNKIFRESGFLQHMKTLQGRKIPNPNEYNMIVKKGTDSTDSDVTGEAIKKAVLKLTGVESHYPPVQSIVQEMLNNSVEYAYDKNADKFWLFCINVDEDGITFIISDGGFGILKTLNRKFKKIIGNYSAP
ncbi:MAG: hypothetical protein SNI58_05040 [Rikenellaceae bacterium]